jgi:hypothetical protein
MLRAVLREYLGTDELSHQFITLNPDLMPITIGRAEHCTYKVGTKFGELIKWVARIQVMIMAEDNLIKIIDGVPGRPSTNGIYCHGDRISPETVLTPGLQLTIFKAERAKVTLEVETVDSDDSDRSHDTFTGEDLLDLLQEKLELLDGQIGALHQQITALDGQIAALHQQVNLFDGQLSQRVAAGVDQEARLVHSEVRLNRVLAVVLGCVAAIVLASGWMGGSAEDRKQWSTTLTSVAIGAAALYFKAKENQLQQKS